MNVLIYQLSN